MIFGQGHEEIGAAILEAWDFAPDLVAAVRAHHHPADCDSSAAAALYLAEFWSENDEDLPSARHLNAAQRRLVQRTAGKASRAPGEATHSTATQDSSAAPRQGGRIARKQITAFTREMATLLEATIPIPSALQGLAEEEENPALRQVIGELAVAVRSGKSFSEAMNAYPKLFPKIYTSMVEVGEEAGALDKVLQDLADLLEHEDEVRGEALSAVAYPAFILGLGILTTAVLLVFVLPRLFGMLEGMMAALPLPTRILLAISRFFQAYWLWVLVGAAACGAAARSWVRSPAGALWWDAVKLRLPAVGGVFRASALARFARTLGTLARSGVSLLPALEISRNTVGNLVYARAIAQVAEETRGGDSLAGPLKKQGLFPPTMVQMIAVGEETGEVDSLMQEVADMYEREVAIEVEGLAAKLEPILIVVMGILVLILALGVFLPIWDLGTAALGKK
jgi:MSHA biogenesis protein MshG